MTDTKKPKNEAGLTRSKIINNVDNTRDDIKKNTTDDSNDNINNTLNENSSSSEDHANICADAFITLLDGIPIMDPETVKSMLGDFIRDKKMSETFRVILLIGARLTPNANSLYYIKSGYCLVLSCMDVDEQIKFQLLLAILHVLLGQVWQANHYCHKALYLATSAYQTSLLKGNIYSIQWSCALLQRNFVLQFPDLQRISSLIDNLEAPNLDPKSIRFMQFERNIRTKLVQYPDYSLRIWSSLESQVVDNERSDLARAYISCLTPRAIVARNLLRSEQPWDEQHFLSNIYYIWEFITTATYLAAPYRALLFPRNVDLLYIISSLEPAQKIQQYINFSILHCLLIEALLFSKNCIKCKKYEEALQKLVDNLMKKWFPC